MDYQFPTLKVETCFQCGATFSCGAGDPNVPCWCANIPVKFPVAGSSCLCPTCLQAKAERHQSDSTEQPAG